MKSKVIKHVFFDLDHTLWDFDKNSELTFQKIFKMHHIDITINDFLAAYQPINLKYWKLYRDEKVDKEQLRYGRLKESFDAVNCKVLDTVIFEIADDYITYLTTFNHVFENTMAVLEYLKPKYKLHIITNGFKEAQQKKLERSNISNYFETVTNSEMAGVKKPNPLIFEYALNAANASVEESIMIGDNYEADIIGALDYGIDAVFFNYHKHDFDPHITVVDDLIELKNHL
ncbi:YjjG family noncanonical pyrimidine nucleotidase [Lacinutrix undariae]